MIRLTSPLYLLYEKQILLVSLNEYHEILIVTLVYKSTISFLMNTVILVVRIAH